MTENASASKFDAVLRQLIEAAEDGETFILLTEALRPEKELLLLAVAQGREITRCRGYELRRPGDLNALLTNLSDRTVVFIEDIDRIRVDIQELLAMAIAESHIVVPIGQGPTSRQLRIELPRFTVVGATENLATVSRPLREAFRFHIDAVLPKLETMDDALANERNRKRSIRVKTLDK